MSYRSYIESANQIYNGQTNEQFRGSKRLYTYICIYIL